MSSREETAGKSSHFTVKYQKPSTAPAQAGGETSKVLNQKDIKDSPLDHPESSIFMDIKGPTSYCRSCQLPFIAVTEETHYKQYPEHIFKGKTIADHEKPNKEVPHSVEDIKKARKAILENAENIIENARKRAEEVRHVIGNDDLLPEGLSEEDSSPPMLPGHYIADVPRKGDKPKQ